MTEASDNSILPWQHKQWEQLLYRRAAGKLPHALILDGPAGTGKLRFAHILLRSLYCSAPGSHGVCGECQSCRWFERGRHPDSVVLEPEADGKTIGIDRVRELGDFFCLKSHRGGIKTALIAPADRMLTAAANSLLKTLEEPMGDSCIVLVSSQYGKLLPTVRSRCQRLHFPPLMFAQAKDWLHQRTGVSGEQAFLALSLAQGAPLTAEQWLRGNVLEQRTRLMQDIFALMDGKTGAVSLATQWLKGDLSQPLYWLSAFLLDCLRNQASAEPPVLCHPDLRKYSSAYALRWDSRGLHLVLREVLKARSLLAGPANAQLLLESLFITMAEYSPRAGSQV